MKRKFQILAFAAITVAALASCAKEQFKENVIPAGEKIQISITGRIGDFTPADATKASAQSVVRVTWSDENDKVYVYDGSALLGTLTVTPDENNASYALLSGTITASAENPAPTKLTLVYVKGATEAPAIAGGKISVDLSTQNQSEVPFVLYSTIDYNASKLQKNSEYVPFSFATSVMTVNCTNLPVGEANAKIGITKAEIEGVSTICELTVTGTGVSIAGAIKGTITRTETSEPSVFTQSDSRGSFRLALAADPETPAARNILVFQETKISGSPFTTTKLEENCSYNTVYQMGEYKYVAPPAGILQGVFTVNSDGKKVHFSQGNLYWDGTNWGFEDEQHYFRTYEGGGKSDANGYNNASGTASGHWGLFGWSTTESNYGRFVLNSYNNYGGTFVDWGKAYCSSEGIAEDTWFTLTGGTDGEWGYLFDHHANVWGECNGVPGRFIAPDGFEGDATALSNAIQNWETAQTSGIIFLPAAGYRGNTTVYYTGGYGKYWSASQDGDQKACNVDFGSDYIWSKSSENRYTGYSVRLVTESAGGYAPAVKVTGVSLNKSKTTIEAGATEILAATVTPANAANKQVNWTSSDTAVATVDENGEVTGVAEGSAVITATTADGNFTAVCLVTVAPGVPAGALKGEFSVQNGKGQPVKQVHFSQGNLYYDGSNFNFEANQYDFRTYAGKNSCIDGTSSDNGTPIDHWGLFGWSTDASSNNWGMHTKTSATDGFTSGNFNDWGKNIGDGNTWRTLSKNEWLYLFDTRAASTVNGTANARYALSTVNSITGIILLPDTYTHPEGVTLLTNINTTNATFAGNTYDSANWAKIESAGAVFLPAAGKREGSNVSGSGFYWSSTANGNDAYGVGFGNYGVNSAAGGGRYYGYSVRLITECQ